MKGDRLSDTGLNAPAENEVERLVQAGYPADARPDAAAAQKMLAQLRAEQRHFYPPVVSAVDDFPLPVLAGLVLLLLALAAGLLQLLWNGQPWNEWILLGIVALGLNLIWIPFACWTIVQRRKNV
ncbi:MAG: hypothetical protein AB9888_04930 [Bacteroidales bacterium]